MKKQYFILQFKMLGRHIRAFGLPPIIGVLFFGTLFLIGSFFLFMQTPFAPYIYGVLPLLFSTILGEDKRNDFLTSLVEDKSYYSIRFIENLLLALPFALFLLYNSAYLMAFISLSASGAISFFRFKNRTSFVLPTPFSKKPFEFTVGFRKHFAYLILAYFIGIMAITAGNFILGVSALVLLYFIMIAFYSEPEKDFFVWIYKDTPQRFLLYKIKTAVVYSSIISLPLTVVLGISFPANIGILSIIFILCLTYLLTFVLAKYAAYPNRLMLPEWLMIVMSFWFPPFLIFLMPYFYKKAISRLDLLEKNYD